MRPNPQDSTACLGFFALQVEVPLLQKQEVLTTSWTRKPTGQCSTFRCLPGSSRKLENRAHGQILRSAKRLLRKEVIQPHLPVRLPCYDLVLIASPTFDGSLHKGWATGFGCYRLS